MSSINWEDLDYDHLTEEQEDYLRDEYEYFDDWMDSDARRHDVTLEDYDFARRVEDYGI